MAEITDGYRVAAFVLALLTTALFVLAGMVQLGYLSSSLLDGFTAVNLAAFGVLTMIIAIIVYAKAPDTGGSWVQ